MLSRNFDPCMVVHVKYMKLNYRVYPVVLINLLMEVNPCNLFLKVKIHVECILKLKGYTYGMDNQTTQDG